MVGGAPQERRARCLVADLEAEPFGEEALGSLLVGGAQDDVSQAADAHRPLTQYAGGTVAGPLDPPGSVVRHPRGCGLHDARLHLDGHRHLGARVDRAQAVGVPDERHLEPVQGRADPAEVVGVVGAQGELFQAAPRRMNDLELFAAVGCGETAVAEVRQPEIGVVGRGVGHIGHPDRDVRHAVQGHGSLLKKLQCAGGVRRKVRPRVRRPAGLRGSWGRRPADCAAHRCRRSSCAVPRRGPGSGAGPGYRPRLPVCR